MDLMALNILIKKYSNAKRLADLKKENVEIESVTPKEFTEIIFED